MSRPKKMLPVVGQEEPDGQPVREEFVPLTRKEPGVRPHWMGPSGRCCGLRGWTARVVLRPWRRGWGPCLGCIEPW